MQFFAFISALLFGVLAAAAPMNVVWVTETDIDVVTVPMTRTVWVSAGEASSTFSPPPPAWTSSSASTSSSVYVAPTTSTSSSVYVAPTTSSSSSVYVAPTSSSVYVAPTTSSSSVYVAPTTSSSSVYVAPTTSSSSVYVAPTTSSSSVYVAPTTSSTSVYVAPTTSSSSVYVAPTTSSSVSITASAAVDKVAQSTTSSAAAASSSSSSSSSSYTSNGLSGIAAAGQAYTGDLTWYETGEGACGWDNTVSDHIVAISEIVFDNPLYATANPNDNPLCGQYVSITGKDGTAYQAKVVDRCTGCKAGDLDLSEDFFNLVTSNGDGRVSDMAWVWV